MTQTVDITPTWQGILPALLTLVESKNHTAREVALVELERMAALADRWVQLCKENN